MFTIRSGFWIGNERSMTASSKLNTVVFAPIPRASESTATRVNAGVFASMRMP